MEACIVICGKIGDILSAVAIAQSMEISHLVTSRRYGKVAEGIPGIQVHYVDSEWDDLAAAIQCAKHHFKRVLVPQTFGKDFPIQHTRQSFQLDQLARSGDIWGDLPRLRLDKPAQENSELKKHQASILFVGSSQSSPFDHADELWAELNGTYGASHTLARLDDIRLDDFKQFVQLYDTAKVLITIDTAHLHLSSASEVPVIAFAADKPQRWRGSADSARFWFYCRYSDYLLRKTEVFRAIDTALAGNPQPKIFYASRTDYPFSYNPSAMAVRSADGSAFRYLAFRHHPDPLKWRTSLVINDSNGTWPVVPPKGYEAYSHEDPRLFMFGGKPHISFVLSEYGTPVAPHCAVGYGELVFGKDHYTIANPIFPPYGKNNWTGSEKNWLFFEQAGKLYCSYQCAPEHVVFEVVGDKVRGEWRTKCPQHTFGPPRGGTQPIPYNGMLLRFFHSQSVNIPERAQWRYHIGAMLMEANPPFQITALSKHPIITGSEAPFFQGHKYYKPNIVFPAGVTTDPLRKDTWLVSYGVNDGICALAHITPEHLNL